MSSVQLELPEGALADRVRYFNELKEPFTFTHVEIPFRDTPNEEQVRAVADNLAEYLFKETKLAQIVRKIKEYDQAIISYAVWPEAEIGLSPFIHVPDYIVGLNSSYSPNIAGVRSAVNIILGIENRSCAHCKRTLEVITQSVKIP